MTTVDSKYVLMSQGVGTCVFTVNYINHHKIHYYHNIQYQYGVSDRKYSDVILFRIDNECQITMHCPMQGAN